MLSTSKLLARCIGGAAPVGARPVARVHDRTLQAGRREDALRAQPGDQPAALLAIGGGRSPGRVWRQRALRHQQRQLRRRRLRGPCGVAGDVAGRCRPLLDRRRAARLSRGRARTANRSWWAARLRPRPGHRAARPRAPAALPGRSPTSRGARSGTTRRGRRSRRAAPPRSWRVRWRRAAAGRSKKSGLGLPVGTNTRSRAASTLRTDHALPAPVCPSCPASGLQRQRSAPVRASNARTTPLPVSACQLSPIDEPVITRSPTIAGGDVTW